MGYITKIAWCDHTTNPWIGCTEVSEGCKNCYANEQNKRYKWVEAWGKGKPRHQTSLKNRNLPIQWAKEAKAEGVIRRVFCMSLGDFLDDEVPVEWRNDLYSVIRTTALYTNTGQGYGLEWLLLTKRIENARTMLPEDWRNDPPDYVRLGVTAENQKRWNERIPQLVDVWHGKNFVSVEPMLGTIECGYYITYINWIILGFESGPFLRPGDPLWMRNVIRQRKDYGAVDTAIFVKQLTGTPTRKLDQIDKFPEDLRIREFPK